MWLLYQLIQGTALLAAAPFLLAVRGAHYLPTLAPRLGRLGGPSVPHRVWLHAVSVGEVGVAATLAKALLRHLEPAERLLVTTVTPTGQARAKALFGGGGLGARTTTEYLPFDLGPPIERFLGRYRPGLLLLVEGDLWPLLLRRVRQRAVPALVVNGRIGDRSYRRMTALRGIIGPILKPITRFGVQTEQDRERLLALGVPAQRLEVTGNLKYETVIPQPIPELERLVQRLAAGRPVLVAGSTMSGEEEQVLEAFARLGGGERALLVLAPRHPERFDRVAERVRGRGLRLERRSAARADAAPSTAVLLLDSLGELADLYRHGSAAFVGGTLVPRGGHNPLEPARFGVPVLVGPSMENFREIAGDFDAASAWRRVADVDDLARAWGDLLADGETARRLGESGRALIEANRGALERTVELLLPSLRAHRPGTDDAQGFRA